MFLSKIAFKAIIVSALLISFSTLATTLNAASLDKIGGLDLGGQKYSEWWYSGVSPILYGTAEPAATVTVKVGEQTSTATADQQGKWQYATGLTEGDHQISITTADYSYTFTLHVGQQFTGGSTNNTTTDAEGKGAPAVPVTGSLGNIFTIAFLAGIMIFGGYKLLQKN